MKGKDEEKGFKQRFEAPITRGEEEQVNKLKRLSEDPNELLKVRKRLKDAGFGQEEQKHEKTPDDSLIIRSEPKKTLKRRNEDSPVFQKKGLGFFKTFIRIITKRAEIFKYKEKKVVKTDLLSLFKFGCGYILGEEPYKFVTEYILSWQVKMKPVFNVLYRRGWRSIDGRKILEPLEFNCIGICSRLTNDRGITEIVYQPHNTKLIYKQANSFMNNYYKLVDMGINKLIFCFKKALLSFINEFPDYQFPQKADDYAEVLFKFFDSRVEHNYIIPLLGAVTGEEVNLEQARREAIIERLDDKEYRADTQLKILMKAREEKYKKKAKKIMKAIETEVLFIDVVQNDLNHLYKIGDKALTMIELSLLLNPKLRQGPRHVVKDLLAVLSLFNDYYAPVLVMSIPVSLKGRVDKVRLFTKEMFFNDYTNIVQLYDGLKPYINKTEVADCTKKIDKKNPTKLKCASIINHICDNFYIMGEKLYKITTGDQHKKKSDMPLDIPKIENYSLPYDEYIICIQAKNIAKEKVFSIDGKKVRETIINIRAFCFNFVKQFESPVGLEEDKIVDRRTLTDRLNRHERLSSVLSELESGEEIELPESIDEI